MSSATSSLVRPRLRGVADIFAAIFSVPAIVVLVGQARPGAEKFYKEVGLIK